MSDLSSHPSQFLLNPKPDMDEDPTHQFESEEEEDDKASRNFEIYNTSIQKSKKLSNEQRRLIFESLLKETKDDKKLKQGTIAAAASYFSVSRRTIVRIWKQARECMARGVHVDVSAKLRGRVGRKRKEIDLTKLEKLADGNRPMNIRELAKALNASKSLIHRRLKEGSITPYLKRNESTDVDDNQAVEVKLCVNQETAGSTLGQQTGEKMVPDYYKILQVDRNAKDDNLNKAYRKLTMQWHHDKNTHNKSEAETMFKQISEAFDVLSDPKKRVVYSQYNGEEFKVHVPSPYAGAATGVAYNGPASFNFNPRNTDDIFKEFFGFSSPLGGMGDDVDDGSTGSRCSSSTFLNNICQCFGESGENQPVPQKAPPIEKTLHCSLEELYNGTTKRMKISRVVFDERGKTKHVEEILIINIRPGWMKGTKIIFSEKGNEQPNVIPADLVYIIDEEPHNVFTRDGNDLVVLYTISLAEALTGCTVSIKTLDGRVLLVPINSVTQVTHEEIVPKEGMCIPKDPTNRGNLRIKFNIKFPVELTADQKAGISKYLPP